MTFLAIFIFAALFVSALVMLFAYSLNLCLLTAIALWNQHKQRAVPPLTTLPNVTVQLPMYNERYVSRRIIDAAARLNWDADKLQIQVLDDSTDDTREIVVEGVRYWKERGINIELLHREDRSGYKAGALAAGLEKATGEFVAVFDADFLPAPDFLHNMIPSIASDPKAAFIQARWDHLNLNSSWLTLIEAVAIDGHFAIEQQARYFGGFAFNFNGTAGVWRRDAIRASGGWQDTTLTEDLDLSYRTWLNGWHGMYLNDYSVPAELPPTMPAFRRQQARWAQGSVECAKLLLPQIWMSRTPFISKLEATVHLLGSMFNPVMALLLICYPILLLGVGAKFDMNRIFGLFSLLGPLTFAPTAFFIIGQLMLRRGWQSLVAVLGFQFISVGMAMNTMRAALKALAGQRGEFLRTPKYGDKEPIAEGYKLKADVGLITDLLWLVFMICLVIVAGNAGHKFIMLYALLSAIGTTWVILWTVTTDLPKLFVSGRTPIIAPELAGD